MRFTILVASRSATVLTNPVRVLKSSVCQDLAPPLLPINHNSLSHIWYNSVEDQLRFGEFYGPFRQFILSDLSAPSSLAVDELSQDLPLKKQRFKSFLSEKNMTLSTHPPPPPRSPAPLLYPSSRSSRKFVTQRFSVRNGHSHDLPRRESFSCFCLARNIHFLSSCHLENNLSRYLRCSIPSELP